MAIALRKTDLSTFLSKASIYEVMLRIEKEIERPLDVVETLGVLKAINSITDVSDFGDVSLDTIILNVSAKIAKKIKSAEDNVASVFGSVGTSVVKIDSLFGERKEKIRTLMDPTSRYKKVYISLDTYNRDLNVVGVDQVRWLYSNVANVDINTSQGYVSSLAPLRNVIGFKIYPFNCYGRELTLDPKRYAWISILIKELESNAYQLGNTKFHSSFNLQLLEPYITPTSADHSARHFGMSAYPMTKDYFWFNTPINDVPSLTLQFISGTTNIPVPYMAETIASPVATYTRFTAGLALRFEFLFRLRWATGTRISISGFRTVDPGATIDAAFLETVNRKEGHTNTVLSVTGAGGPPNYITFTDLIVPVGISAIASNLTVVLVNETSSLNIPVEFICLAEDED
jgi:hypothetical protein